MGDLKRQENLQVVPELPNFQKPYFTRKPNPVMPHIRAYLHCVWTTKHRTPYLYNLSIRKKVWNHIFHNARKKSIGIIAISGHIDHCHCLISLKSDQTLRKTMQLLKGESSFWVNKNNLLSGTGFNNFEWQDEYYITSVSPRALNRVKDYIHNQEEHHLDHSLQEELQEYFKPSGFEGGG